jgi:ubiquinone/menaquinone biosynthesis C-methylase UbiE
VHRLIALDIQAEMLQRLRRKPAGSQLLSVQGDATQLPLAENSIDVVIAVTVLGEVPSAERTIAEVRRVLRPSGVFSVSEHLPDPDFLPLRRVSSLCQEGGMQLRDHYGSRFGYTANFSLNAASEP